MPTRRRHYGRERRKRLDDFAKRLAAASEACPFRPECVRVHPLADERELLARIGVEPAECLYVDAYWHIGGDVLFLEIAAPSEPLRPEGIYARRAHEDGRVVVRAVLGTPSPIDTETMRTVMSRVRQLRIAGAPIVSAGLGPHLRRVG